ncbi:MULTISPECIES: glycosyltransferase [Hyphobacterium]|uniref:Glycosyltransferase n=1 Tax=Hyphobacterium vulgare TaxID=1736751 RepID=A0ABV6ZVH3_9PROT
MRFLILTPVLNGARYLDAALQSVRAQYHQDWKLIVCDGGSSDGTLDIARRHASEDQRITVESASDAGMYDALRRQFDRFSGRAEVLSWLNSDDLYTPWALIEADAAFVRGALWVTGLPGLFDNHGRLRAVLPCGENRRSDILAGRRHDGFLGAIQQESVFFSTALYADLTPIERDIFATQTLAGDFHLWRCFARRAELVTLSSVLGGFRLHSKNRSRLNPEVYESEVAALGATQPPRLIARLWRYLHNRSAARAAFKAYETAAAELANEVSSIQR